MRINAVTQPNDRTTDFLPNNKRQCGRWVGRMDRDSTGGYCALGTWHWQTGRKIQHICDVELCVFAFLLSCFKSLSLYSSLLCFFYYTCCAGLSRFFSFLVHNFFEFITLSFFLFQLFCFFVPFIFAQFWKVTARAHRYNVGHIIADRLHMSVIKQLFFESIEARHSQYISLMWLIVALYNHTQFVQSNQAGKYSEAFF